MPWIFRAGSASSALIASCDRTAGHDLVGDGPHLGLDPGQFGEAPGVRLLQVHRGTEEVTGREPVPVPPDGLLVPAERRQLLAEEPAVVGGGVAGGVRRALEIGSERPAHPAVGDDPARESGPEVVLVRVDPGVALFGDLEHLVAGGDVPVRGRLQQRRPGLGERGRHRREPVGHRRCGLFAVGRHQVEHRPYGVQRTGDDVHLAGGGAGVVHLEVQAEPLLHRLLGYPLRLVGRGDRVDLGQGPSIQFGQGGVALRGELGKPVVVAGDTDKRRANRVEFGPLVDVAVSDRVDVSHEARLAHREGVVRISRDSCRTGRQ